MSIQRSARIKIVRDKVYCSTHDDHNFFMSIGNNSLSVTHIEYTSTKVPAGLSGYRIVQISDLHNHCFDADQSALIAIIKKQRPDLIVITGDLMDRRHKGTDAVKSFIRHAVDIAPVRFVTGNHEAMSCDYKEFSVLLEDAGVIILDNAYEIIIRNGSIFKLMGLPDPSFFKCKSNKVDIRTKEYLRQMLKGLNKDEAGTLTVLLAHRPDLIKLYSDYGVDLVFSGHAHGGQVRLPLIGGLYSPGQGLFPRFTNGAYKYMDTTMIISRGLGNSLFPLRIFNPPEIITLTLNSGYQKKDS